MKQKISWLFLTYIKWAAKLQLLKNQPTVIGITGSAGKTSTQHAVVATLLPEFRLKYTYNANSEHTLVIYKDANDTIGTHGTFNQNVPSDREGFTLWTDSKGGKIYITDQKSPVNRSNDPSDDDNTVGYSKDVEFTQTDTGAGYDTLMLNPNDTIDLNLDNISSITKNIEEITMEDSSTTGDKLTIDVQDILDMTDDNNQLFIKGDNNDMVELDDSEGSWSKADSDQSGYDMYTGSNGTTLYIDTDIDNVVL